LPGGQNSNSRFPQPLAVAREYRHAYSVAPPLACKKKMPLALSFCCASLRRIYAEGRYLALSIDIFFIKTALIIVEAVFCWDQ